MNTNEGGARRYPRFVRDDRGGVAIIFAMMAVPAMALAGFAVDYGRAVTARSKLQQAVDAAAMAAVSGASTTEAQKIAIATSAFAANLKGVASEPDVQVSGSRVTVAAAGSVQTSFGRIAGVNELDFSVSSTAEGESGMNLELSMMIDVTGSMAETRSGSSKIAGLRLAGKDLISILFPNGATSSSSVRVAIAPFADYVNAGPYAAAATGQDADGAAPGGPVAKMYSKISNLTKTKQGSWYGSYSGLTANTAGAQFGTTTTGTTYASGHCTAGSTFAVTYLTKSGTSRPYGIPITVSGSPSDSALPAGIKRGTSSAKFEKANAYDNTGSNQGWKWYGYSMPSDSQISSSYTSSTDDVTGYYVPMPDDTGVAGMEWEKDSNGRYLGIRVGLYDVSSYADRPAQFLKASSVGGFRPVTGWSSSGYSYGSTSTSGYFMPIPKVALVSNPSCTAAQDQPNGKLITCVTERADSASRYTDDAPASGKYVGKYAKGTAGVSMYSEDGKCWVAGRELPAIMPLTNDRENLDAFFDGPSNNGPQVGGATPGHIGTAWAWYMLSPKWASIWPAGAVPTSYGTEGVMKAAVLMTDGEYNIQYQSETSRNQALALCDNMRAAGIKVYTVGFGFSTTSKRTDNTAEGKAKDLLMKCAGEQAGAYFFPYDGSKLREDFQTIGAQLKAGLTVSKAKLVN